MLRPALQRSVCKLRCFPSVTTSHKSFRTSSENRVEINSEKGGNGHYDVIIVGGGAAGLSMACALSKNTKLSDKKLLLLDGAPVAKPLTTSKYSNRVFAINRGTVELMKSIGAWNTIQSIRYQPVKQMQVWDSCSDALITFNDAKFSDDMAYIVENDVLLHAILKEIDASTNVTMRNSARIERLLLPKDGFKYGSVTLGTGENYSCDLMIGADGANSIVRKQMGVVNYSTSYNQMGLIATVNLSEACNNNIAWQRFLPNGVIALLPLTEQLSSIVWSSSTANVKRLLALSETDFIDAVNEAFWKQYDKSELVSKVMGGIQTILGNHSQSQRQLPPCIKSLYESSRAAFPLGFGHSSNYVSKGTALIGDAAHRVHPLAGQGLNLGFGDVSCLANILATASYNGSALGDMAHLRTYEGERLRHNVPIMLGIHGIQKMYSTDFSPVVLARSVGLQLAHAITPLKKIFMERAMR